MKILGIGLIPWLTRLIKRREQQPQFKPPDSKPIQDITLPTAQIERPDYDKLQVTGSKLLATSNRYRE